MTNHVKTFLPVHKMVPKCANIYHHMNGLRTQIYTPYIACLRLSKDSTLYLGALTANPLSGMIFMTLYHTLRYMFTGSLYHDLPYNIKHDKERLGLEVRN
jgi:hypothetical protein